MTYTIANPSGARELRWRRFDLPSAEVHLAQLCDSAAAQAWFARLDADIPWKQHRLRLFGRQVAAPRLSCWMGDVGAAYTYSRVHFEPQPWTPAVAELRDATTRLCGERYNAALCNLYRGGQGAMGWHSDDEPELGPAPVIASLSFGAPRRFRLRHKLDPDLRLELELESGSLLYMAGATQANYRHDLPRSARVTEPRINLTFRRVLIPAQ